MSKLQVKTQFNQTELFISTGELAKQANGSVLVQYGGTVVLITACMDRLPLENYPEVLPLVVEYQEKTYAAGRIPGGFFKREGRPSENEILCARLIDRPIRPLFPKGFSHNIQIIAVVISADQDFDPDVLAVLGASSALYISDIPFDIPIGCCRVGFLNGEFIINPTYKQREEALLDIVVASSSQKILMIEAKSKGVDEDIVLKAIKLAYENNKRLIALQEELREKAGKKKRDVCIKEIPEKLIEKLKEDFYTELIENLKISDKIQRLNNLDNLIVRAQESLKDVFCEDLDKIKPAFYEIQSEFIREKILKEKIRPDNRTPDEIREVSCKVGVLPRTHGSALFTRGQTQALAVTTLGSTQDMQLIEALEGQSFKRFMLHYSFPPFSVGEVRPVRGPSRREIGHGNLAERALECVIPKRENFPYTIRVVSEILESNGSSSMATVCAGSLSLMDAGVPVSEHVAGLAFGLIEKDSDYVILTDIAGAEDHAGFMDFKIAGTRNKITAIQLDVKNKGLDFNIIEATLKKAKVQRQKILDLMYQTIDKPRAQISELAPRITTMQISPDKIGDLIGPGGKNIRKIIQETQAVINIENDGTITITTPDQDSQEKAVRMVKEFTQEIKVGEVYKAKVVRVTNYGAFCEILPGKIGLCHISELSDGFIRNINEFVKVGDEILVKVIGIDELGRITLSKKRANVNKEKNR